MASFKAALECLPAADAAFGPQVSQYVAPSTSRYNFEESILRLGTAALFSLLALGRVALLFSQPRRTAKTALFWAKLACAALLAALQVILTALLATDGSRVGKLYSLSLASSVILLFTDLVLGGLSYLEHLKSIRPSSLIDSYLLVSILLEAAYVRTLWLSRTTLVSVSAVTTASLAVRILLLVLESQNKQLLPPVLGAKPIGKEETTGIFTRSLHLWLIELLRLGYSKVLNLDDLYTLESGFLAEELTAKFERQWAKERRVRSHAPGIVKTTAWHLLAPVFPRLCLIGLTFAQPFLLSHVLAYLASDISEDSKNIGYGLIGAYAFVYAGIAFATSWYQYLLYRFITLVRGVLVSVIYSKALDISLSAASDGQAVTLMSTDVERIVTGLQATHEVWATVLQVALAAWLLHNQLGVPFFLPILFCFSATSSMLKAIKGVKLSGMSERLGNTIQALRAREIASASQYRVLMSIVIVVAFMPQTLAPVLTFGASLGMNDSQKALSAGRLFSSLLLLKLLTSPLTQLFQAAPILMSAIECVGRVQTFLCSQKREDTRRLLRSRDAASTTASLEKSNVVMEAVDAADTTAADAASADSSTVARLSTRAICVKNGHFGWTQAQEQEGNHYDNRGEVMLENIHFSLDSGQFAILVGPTGCGKSTLLKALLCETPVCRGTVEVSTRQIAFCDQKPWLMNGTIQQNILGENAWDQEWYSTVVHACALDEDFAVWEKGDQSELGSNGTNLSGGQRQRVAIARAVYSRCRILLLDDVLSGLDRKTEWTVCDRLFAKGRGLLCQRSSLTVLLATHSAHLLPMADHIIALGSDGTIAQQGTFEELVQAGGYVSSLLDVHARENEENEGTDGNSEINIHVSKEQPSSSSSAPHREAYSLGPQRGELPAQPEDAAVRQTGDMAVYLYYFRASRLSNVAIYFGLQVAWATLGNFPMVVQRHRRPQPPEWTLLWGYAGLQVGYLIVLCLLCAQVLLNMQVISGKKLHAVLLKAAIGAPMSFFSATDSGVLLNIFSQDLQILDSDLPFALQNTVANALASVAQAILLVLASYWMAITYPFLIGSFYLVQRFYLRTSRQLRLLDLEAKSPLYTAFLESLDGIATIRAFGWEPDFVQVSLRLLDQSQKPFYLLYCVQRWLTLVLDLVVAGLAVVLMALSTQLRGSNPSGFTAVSLFNLASLAQTMTTTVTTWALTEVAMGAVARIRKFGTETPSENESADATPEFSGRVVPESWPAMGQIEFQDVTAYYKDGSVKALDGLSLSIRPGEKIGICGRTGSGKSTLVQALFRLIDADQGSISIDGVDISTLPREDLRERLNAIPQEPFFMPGSFRSNMDFGRSGVSTESIENALRTVGLWDTVEKAGGLDCPLSEDTFSHGQRQMFCLARAMLRSSKVVVLDEATSSVDVDTDRMMQYIVRSAFAGATILAVAHRLNTILDFDRIAVLDKGRMIELDSPAALLAREDSVFKELYDMYEEKEKKEKEVQKKETI